ncbi:MAG: ATP-grasp fold amidoligase family protein [bacterium]
MSIKELISPSMRRKLYKILDFLPDKTVVKLQYRASVGRKLNLNNPVRFTEKVQWYKLNYRVPLMTQCADKYRMRSYVIDKGYGGNLPILYGVYDSFEDIKFNVLPKSFVIKCNNGSGTNIFIRNKADMDMRYVKSTVKSWKRVNTLSVGREWAYKNIPQKIIIEEFLISDESTDGSLNDYKILCFNGKPEYVWVDISRQSDHRRDFFDLEWNHLDVVSNYPLSSMPVSKPEGFETMLKISEDFANDFPFVRVDFYSIRGNVYIGELTFYPWSGCVKFIPDSFDFKLGNLFVLPPVTML